MQITSVPKSDGRDWLPGNPWTWLGLGLICLAASWLLLAGSLLPALRHGLLIAGLSGVALAVRWNLAEPAYLKSVAPFWQSMMLLGLSALYLFLAGALSLLLILSFVWPDDYYPWRWGPVLIIWLVVAPMSAVAGRQCFRRGRASATLSRREEAALLLLLAALACRIAIGALYDKARPQDLDTIRFFFGIVSLVALAVSPLLVVPPTVGRKVMSLFIVLHFVCVGGFAWASLKGSVMLHMFYSHISRPYLDFLVLGNPHAYFVEESPPSQLWFRIRLEGGAQEWVKVPNIDERGNYGPTKVNAQRRSMLPQPTVFSFPPSFSDATGRPLEFYQARLRAANPSAEKNGGMYVPFLNESEMPVAQQCQFPMPHVSELLKNYVTHVVYEAQQDGRRVEAVKVYRVKHHLVSIPEYLKGVKEPWDPDTFVSVFMGGFDANGNQVNAGLPVVGAAYVAGLVGLTCPTLGEGPLAVSSAACPERYFGDPLLYWVLPTVREGPKGAAIFRSYCRKHAGDPAWIRNASGEWVENEP